MVINSSCLTDKKELTIPGKMATGKELSNPLMAGSLPKTTLPTQLTTLKIKTVNDDVRLQAIIDGKKVGIIEASIRHDLKLNNTEGIFVNPSLTKNVFANEESRNMVSRAVIPLFDIIMVQAVKEVGDLPNADQDTPIPDAPSSSQPQRKHKPRRKEKKERKETKVSPTEDPVPTPFSDLLPSGEDNMPLKELTVLRTNLSNKVLDLENEVIEMKSSYKAKIAELESRVDKLEGENRSLTKELKSFNSKVESLAVKETVVDEDTSSKQGRKIADIGADVEVVTTAKFIVDEVSNAGGELNAANEEPVSVAPTNITTTQPSKATKITVNISTAPKAKGIVFDDLKESTTRTTSSKVHVKDKGKDKLVEKPKKSRKAQFAIDEEVARMIEVEWNGDIQDNIDWNEVVKQENAKKQKLEEQQEVEELKRNLEIVPNDEDDVFVNVAPFSSKPPTTMDYKIYKEGKKEHFQIIRANGNHQMYLAFNTILKNFNREDLEVLWKIVKDRFKESQAKEVLDVFLWHTLKVMFEHSVEESVWKL
nr:hypothetical protein [Tanacetum cinerariifolium]